MPARPQISVLMRCHRDAAAVARILREVAPFAEEIVVAADARMPEDELATLAAAGPVTLLRVPFTPPVERALPYLHSRCGGRWILRLDGDELPSIALLESLRELARDRHVVAHVLPRAWLWPSLDRVLAQRPWWPDAQVRMVRNDPATVSFPGYTHSATTPHGPVRLFEGPALYHADLAGTTAEERVRKVVRYEAERPGLEMLGLPFNVAYYLPERHPEPPVTELVPEADRGRLEAVFAGTDGGLPAAEPAAPELAPEAEIDALWAGHEWPPEAYDARVEVVDRDLRFSAGEARELLVAVENHGTRTLPWGEHEAPVIRLSYRWLAGDGSVVVPDGLRTGLPGPVPPGARRLAQLAVAAPAAGDHVLEVDLVHEHVRWFGRPARAPIAVL